MIEFRQQIKELVAYILNPEEKDEDVIENYTDTVILACEEYHIKQLKLYGVVFNEASENLNISDVISSKNHLLKDEILSTGDWDEGDYANMMEGYLWKHKSIQKDGYVVYMRRYKNDGYTTIEEQGKEENKLFEGYISNIEELNQIVHLCRLHN